MLWQATPASLWQGRDDSAEAPNALRLFQTIARAERFAPQEMPGDIALLGFACDEGVRRNKGRTGAADGPATLRRALANMASHQGHDWSGAYPAAPPFPGPRWLNLWDR